MPSHVEPLRRARHRFHLQHHLGLPVHSGSQASGLNPEILKHHINFVAKTHEDARVRLLCHAALGRPGCCVALQDGVAGPLDDCGVRPCVMPERHLLMPTAMPFIPAGAAGEGAAEGSRSRGEGEAAAGAGGEGQGECTTLPACK